MKHFVLSLAVALFLGANTISQAEDTRADFLKLIALPRVPLAPQVRELSATGGLVEFHFSFASDAQQRVPGLLLEKENSKGRRPVVIVMHGTGGRKEDELPLLRRLARAGFVAVAIDGRYHGERAASGHGSADYQAAIVRAWEGNGGHQVFDDRVRDVRRVWG